MPTKFAIALIPLLALAHDPVHAPAKATAASPSRRRRCMRTKLAIALIPLLALAHDPAYAPAKPAAGKKAMHAE